MNLVLLLFSRYKNIKLQTQEKRISILHFHSSDRPRMLSQVTQFISSASRMSFTTCTIMNLKSKASRNVLKFLLISKIKSSIILPLLISTFVSQTKLEDPSKRDFKSIQNPPGCILILRTF